VSALGDEPEDLPVQPVAYGRAPRLTGAPPGRLKQGVARRRDAQLPGEHHYRVDHAFLERIDEPVLG
jgi:hypothetical protein